MKNTKAIRRTAKRLFRVCISGGRLDEGRLRDVVRRVSATGTRSRLGVLEQMRRLVKLELARHTAVVESATVLAPELKAEVQERLERIYGGGMETSFAEEPLLIGGMRIRVASDVYDGSIRGRLRALEASF
jgi:F-type H+-transporting ATPase subunit delta